MFKISPKTANEFKQLFELHRLNISASNIFLQNVRLLNTHRYKIIDRETYKEYYYNILNDIALETSPIDMIIPDTSDEIIEPGQEAPTTDLFTTNQLVPEYVKISKRVTLEDLYSTFPETHDVSMKLKQKPELLTDAVDDIFIYFCIYKYLEHIDLLHIQDISKMAPIIEYVVNNVTLKDIKDFLISRRINEDKYAEKGKDILFNPDLTRKQKFYSEAHDDIPAFDVVNLMMRLITNIVCHSDIYIITGIYLTLSFAMADIANNKVDDSPHVTYVRDVLSKI
jgi:hypothetical protein